MHTEQRDNYTHKIKFKINSEIPIIIKIKRTAKKVPRSTFKMSVFACFLTAKYT